MRAAPVSIRQASLRVDSCVLIRPSRGRVTWRRSGSTRIVPVVNRTVTRDRRVLNLGKPTAAPARSPERDLPHASSALARASSPVLYASFEFSAHQGATSCLRWFQARRSAGSDHPNPEVNSPSGTP